MSHVHVCRLIYCEWRAVYDCIINWLTDAVPATSVEKSEQPVFKESVSQPVSAAPSQVTEPEHYAEKSSEPIQLTTAISEVPPESVEHTAAEDEAPVPEKVSVTPVVDLQEEPVASDDPDARGVRIYTDTTEGVPQVERDVQVTEEVLPDGTVVRRQVVTTSQHQTVEGVTREERDEAPIPAKASVTPVVDLQEEPLASDDPDARGVRIYTDTTEGVPQVERDVQETEEVLPDGTVVRRQVVTTSQRQTISTRVVMEGPEDILPASKAEAEQLLGEMGVSEELGRQIATSDSEPQASTNVEEHEEVLPDGSVVKRRVVTTTKQHVTTERVSLEDDDIPAGSTSVG